MVVGVALCDYDCVCNYDYAPKAPSPFPQENNNKNVGLVQVFECRPLINVTVDGKWAAVAINHTVRISRFFSRLKMMLFIAPNLYPMVLKKNKVCTNGYASHYPIPTPEKICSQN